MRPAVDPVKTLLLRYFRALEAGRFDDAAACFTEDVFYLRPPFSSEPPGSPSRTVKGRDELVRMWREFRSNSSTMHHVGTCIASGDRAFVSGVTTDTQRADRVALSYWVVRGVQVECA
jgi:ketosteroid isomerase-like protein